MATTTATGRSAAERAAELNVIARKQRSLWRDALYRLLRNRAAILGLAVIVLAAIIAILAPFIAPYDPLKVDTKFNQLEPVWTGSKYTNPAYPLGTDQLGRDILSRLMWAARVSMVVGFIPTTMVFAIGIAVGLSAGYFGGWVDQGLMRLTDIVYAFPDFLFVLIIVASFRNSAFGNLLGGLVLIFAAVAIVGWIGIARLTRGQVLALKEREFVEAARAIGAGPTRIMTKHLLPNALAPLIVTAAFAVPGAIIGEATLSFLGVGIKPPTPSWGAMINEGFIGFSANPWAVLLPAICISIVMLAFTFVGDGLRDALDPRMKS
ncbi:MAG TPA: ABC transporter permease [Candidatus Limnocylindria bacterium]|nr:ABC transporter permease [Candidatus Limnocylindria bacterium]